MEFPEVDIEYDWKIIAIIIAVILIGIFAIWLMITASPANVYFEQSTVEDNSQTNLIVEVTNNQDRDVNSLVVQVTPIDPNSITIENPVQEESNVGRGEKRIFKFPTNIGNARPGTYSVEIEIKLGTEKIEQRAMIEIK